MIQASFAFPNKTETFCEIVPGEKSSSGLFELHWKDRNGDQRFIVLPEKAQHQLLDALLWERRRDIAKPEVVKEMEAMRL